MFQGTIPPDARRIIHEALLGWQSKRVAVACSGNFTLERLLYEANRFDEIHGCDVTIYSCTIGAYLAGNPLNIALAPAYADALAWLAPSLDGDAGTVATLQLLSNVTLALKPNANRYYTRLYEAYRHQWDDLHTKTTERLQNLPLRLTSFHIGDAVPWLATLPPDMGVISYPPFFSKGYERMFAMLDEVFTWDAPTYAEIFDQHRADFIHHLTNRPDWLLITHTPIDDLQPHLIGTSQSTNRGMKHYLYASSAPTRIVTPAPSAEPLPIPRLTPAQTIAPHSTIALQPLTSAQFQTLRAQYLDPTIPPASTNGFAVLVDNRIIGAFALQNSYGNVASQADTIYLLSDFAVAPTDYKRLSKLTLYAARSKATQLLAERLTSRRIRYIMTTAFSDNPVSMKYRGLFKLHSRKHTPTAPHPYQLNYIATLGDWTLTEGLQQWLSKHSN